MRTKAIVISVLILLISTQSMAQIGISVTPPRVYYTADPGQTDVKQVVITNVSASYTMDLSITLGDWMYNELGENIMYPADSLDNSLAAWVSIPSGSYFSLKPNESKTINVGITVPEDVTDPLAVHTAMLYVTQMNPVEDINEQDANIKINVRSGIKLFQKSSLLHKPMVNITNLTVDKDNNSLWLEFENTGNIWIDGTVNSYIFNKSTGNEIELGDIMYYTMPGDIRKLSVSLPDDLEKGEYTATLMLDYGNDSSVEAAEIEFEHE